MRKALGNLDVMSPRQLLTFSTWQELENALLEQSSFLPEKDMKAIQKFVNANPQLEEPENIPPMGFIPGKGGKR